MIELENVSKSYGSVAALLPFSLRFEAEATSVLIGPSGCGKSTILRLINGLIEPDCGIVRIQGEILSAGNRTTLRRRMGYVIQEGGLFPHMSGRKNVAVLARQLGWTDEEINRRVRELSELVHLPVARLEDYPAQLSGGERQRVSLMRALMLDPDVLLLDEPLGALDPMIRAGLQDELKAIFERLKKTVVLVTHDLAEAGFFADVVVLLRAGRIVQRGSFESLLKHPETSFAEDFVRAQRSLSGRQ